MKLSRRHFLQTAGAVTLGFAGLHKLLESPFGALADVARPGALPFGFGELIPDPKGVFELPKGFTYKVISRAGDLMADGLLVPGEPDGMATFPGPDGRTILICNHEMSAEPANLGAFGKDYELIAKLKPGMLYDAGRGKAPSLGGTTRLIFDTAAQKVEKVELSLGGTLRNCAGGPTPWNSWLTCEENVQRAEGNFERDHGYVFEVPATPGLLAPPNPIRAMGRFNHEAVAVDPKSGAVYQTEDRSDGLIYRYLPTVPGDLHKGGKLQALVVKDRASCDTRNWPAEPGAAVPPRIEKGTPLAVEWIDVEDVEAPKDDLRDRGFAKGAARFARGEGMWYGNDAVYFACTNGGPVRHGQVWKYTPSPAEGTPAEKDSPATLELFLEADAASILENCDNLTVAPWGDLVLCEDGPGHNYLLGVTPKGEIYRMGRCSLSQSELAGATFSPDGSTLFVNIQHNHMTLAITGPWHQKKAAG